MEIRVGEEGKKKEKKYVGNKRKKRRGRTLQCVNKLEELFSRNDILFDFVKHKVC